MDVRKQLKVIGHVEHKLYWAVISLFALELCSIFGVFTDFYTVVQAEMFLAFVIAYIAMPRCQGKAVILALTLYHGYILATDWWLPHVGVFQSVLELTFFGVVALYQSLQPREIVSDKHNPANIILAFYKPRKVSEYIVALFGCNTSSMSVIAGNSWYTFKRNRKFLVRRKYAPKLAAENYTLIDTGVPVTAAMFRELEGLIGTSARQWQTLFMRNNCVRVFEPLLKMLGGKWVLHGLDVIPSIYLHRRIEK